MINFDSIQQASKDSMDMAMNNFGTMSKSLQAITVEMTDFSRKSIEEGSAAMEKMLAAKSIDTAMEIQTAYAKSSYDNLVGQMTRIGEMYTDLAKDTYKPFETALAKASK